tara:strand:- start:24251 stop:24709 length:459 start_codon:yes stop_codon:yes gene_type:complete
MTFYNPKIEIVEITARFIKKGQTDFYEDLEGLLFEKDFDDTIHYIKTNEPSKENIRSKDNIIFKEDNIILTFRWVGDSNSDTTAIDYIHEHDGDYIFEDDKDTLIELAKKKRHNNSEYVKFLVKYGYSSWQTLEGDYDDMFELLGEIDVKKL